MGHNMVFNIETFYMMLTSTTNRIYVDVIVFIKQVNITRM